MNISYNKKSIELIWGLNKLINDFTRYKAFTLAEVLITLGIIGVVAAMTLPTLINQTNGAQYKAAFKKSLSAISQAVTLSVTQDDLSFSDIERGTAGSVAPPASGGVSAASLLNSKMKVIRVMAGHPYSPFPSYPSGVPLLHPDTCMIFNDGSMFCFDNNTSSSINCHMGTNICQGFIDVNGLKGPNKTTVCDTIEDTQKDNVLGGQISHGEACTVKNPADIYHVYYYDQTIVPGTNAGRAVLYGK